MLRKTLAAIIALTLIFTTVAPPSYAAKAIVLSDQELDTVYAQGFSGFEFGSFIQPSSIIKPSSHNSGLNKIATPSSSQQIHTKNNSNIKSIQFGTTSNGPRQGSTSQGPAPILNPLDHTVAPILQQTDQISNPSPSGKTNISSSTNTSTDINDLPQNFGKTAANLLSSPSDVSVAKEVSNNPASQVSVNDLNSVEILNNASTLPGANDLDQFNSAVDSSSSNNTPADVMGTNTFPTANEISQANDMASIPANLFPVDNSASGIAVNNLEANNSTPTDNLTPMDNPTPTDNLAPADNPAPNAIAPIENSTPVALTNNTATPEATSSAANDTNTLPSPNNTVNQPAQLQLVATQGPSGEFDIGGYFVPSDPTDGLAPPEVQTPGVPTNTVPIGNGGVNIVEVGAFSQQYLSAFVNVNAAGSIVPIILNITININSTVNGLTNSNSLNISNHNFFTIQ